MRPFAVMNVLRLSSSGRVVHSDSPASFEARPSRVLLADWLIVPQPPCSYFTWINCFIEIQATAARMMRLTTATHTGIVQSRSDALFSSVRDKRHIFSST